MSRRRIGPLLSVLAFAVGASEFEVGGSTRAEAQTLQVLRGRDWSRFSTSAWPSSRMRRTMAGGRSSRRR
jgi:hypothetical protein